MTCTWSTAASVGLVALLRALGCGLVVSSDELGDEIDGVAADIDEYEELAATLEAARTQALDEHATALRVAGPWLAWLDGQTLTVRDHAQGAQGADGV